MNCPLCGISIPDDSKFCQYCGGSLPEISPDSKLENSASQAPALKPVEEAAPKEEQTIKPVENRPRGRKAADKYCSRCGSKIDRDTKKCTGCGKQYFRLPKISHKISFAIIVVVILLLSTGGFFAYNYYNGVDAMNQQEFIVAQQYFDNMFIGDKLFPNKYAYIEAGVLMEEGEYIEALKVLNTRKDAPVPAEILEDLKLHVYFEGQAAYNKGNLDEAEDCFNTVKGFRDSEDYLFLISVKNTRSISEYHYDGLVARLSCADAKEVIFSDVKATRWFLLGLWEEGGDSPLYFDVYEEDGYYYCNYNLPGWDYDRHNIREQNDYGNPLIAAIIEGEKHQQASEALAKTTNFSDGIYYDGAIQLDEAKLFKFTIINEDTIKVYCYKDGSTHTLYRQ